MSNYFRAPRLTFAREFISHGSRHFYIPACQRQFVWSKQHIHRFFDDIEADMGQRMVQDSGTADTEAVSFIGTLVFFEDKDYKVEVGRLPGGIHAVMDGQQRISLLMMTAVILHDYMRVLRPKVGKDFLHSRYVFVMDDLHRMIESDQVIGDEQYYPLMIRASDDQWSTSRENSRYVSPISHYLSSYGDFSRNDKEGRPFKYDRGASISGMSDEQKAAHLKFAKVAREVRARIERICRGESEFFPDIKQIFNKDSAASEKVLKDILHLHGSVDDFSPDNPKHCEFARAWLLAAYLVNKVYFLSLVARDENYAFEVSDSLNGAGYPVKRRVSA